jgi:hypothetical protein
MKILCALALLTVAVTPAVAAQPITPGQALGYQGSNVTIEGTAMILPSRSTHLDEAAQVRLGDSDNPGAFVGYINKSDLKKFPDLAALDGKTVDISGVVEGDFGLPEIRISSPDQITVSQ